MTTASSNMGEVGLNLSKITAMQSALDNYINRVVKYTDISLAVQQIQLAVKGTNSENEVKSYLLKLTETCQNIEKDLSKYKNILSNMAASYKSYDKFS